MANLPTSKAEAISIGATHFFTNKPCSNGHLRKRRVSDGHCLDCDNDYWKRKRKLRPAAVSKIRKKYYQKTRDDQLALRRKQYANNENVRVNKKDKDLRKMYGISLDDYYALKKQQNSVCALCFSSNTNKRTCYLDVDHSHKTGKVRGLLCTNCNQGLGKFKDDVQLLKRAIQYLEA